MQEAEGVDEALKAADQLKWVRRMNSIRNRAEEIIKTELILYKEVPTMTVLKPMLKLALLLLLLLLILAQWVGIFLTTFSTILTNLLAGLFFFVALTSWVMKLADGGEVLKMLITAFVVFVLPYIAIAAIAKISFFAEELRDFLQS